MWFSVSYIIRKSRAECKFFLSIRNCLIIGHEIRLFIKQILSLIYKTKRQTDLLKTRKR